MSASIPAGRWGWSFTASALSFLLLAPPSRGAQDCTLPTFPAVRTLHQPDGTAIELFFRGNGSNHWYEDRDGFPVVDTDAGYSYARRASDGRLVSTQALVGARDPRRLGIERRVVPVPPRRPSPSGAPFLFEEEAFDERARTTRLDDVPYPGPRGPFLMGSGTVKNLVLLLRFSNHGPGGQNRTLPSNADVSTIMNAVGGHPTLAPTGSVRDHYIENSYGELVLNSTVVGWLTMPNSETYYADGNSGLTTVIYELIADGLNAADPLVDFSDFDGDGDGWIDAITILHSGYGAEWMGNDQYGTNYFNRIWSHKSVIPTWTSAEGVSVGAYNLSAGLWSTTGSSPFRIGVVAHELGHYFGLPDQYDTDGSSTGTGNWCLMASGVWGFDDDQLLPSHMCAWCKLKLGWVVPERILPGTYLAPAVENDPSIYMIDSGYSPGEYLLIENRQSIGFDGGVPQGGLALWHVDESKGTFTYEDTNNDEGYPGQAGWPGNDEHYRIGLLQADGTYDLEHFFDGGDAGDLYRSGLATVIDASTTPDTDAYQQGTLVTNFNRLEGIGASSSNMAFTYVNVTAPAITTPTLLFAFEGLSCYRTFQRTGGSGPFTWSEFRIDTDYTLTDLGAQTFVMGGTAQGFNADEGTWAVNLPFRFPFYEGSYSRVYVSPNGCVDLVPLEGEPYNTAVALRCLPRIAGLWDDLTTNGGAGLDIYVDTSVSGEARIRWQAETVEGALPVNFAITLHADGRIRFDYGGGNTGLTPTVGISRSHSADFLLADTHDGQDTLTNASSLEFELAESWIPPGLTLSSTGVLSGTPTGQYAYLFHLRVTDSAGRYDQRPFVLVVLPTPQRYRDWPHPCTLAELLVF